ncbi:MAG: hypothetical protein JNK33_06770, partial [Candidatus Doudnabacteria bacterium]|nr:hypothetical protein [Candidatus Doudnabacteria bacterium]
MNKRFFITIVFLSLFFVACSNDTPASPVQSQYVASVAQLVQEQAQAKTITAKITKDPRFPNLTNISTVYFLTDFISKI